MNFLQQLDNISKKNNSFLCIGLDVDLEKIPNRFLSSSDSISNFNKMIVDATKNFVCAYKPNSAFYEMYGIYGLKSLLKTIEYIPNTIPVILDSKRGDISHSSSAYAKSIFEVFKADATTVNPLMGHDSIKPFTDYKDKGVFLLCLTSNPGSLDFQKKSTGNKKLYEEIAEKAVKWNQHGNIGLVAGATNPKELKKIREIAGNIPILIPGVGAQKGELGSSVKFGTSKNKDRFLINASRSIIYSSNPARSAKLLRDQINSYL